MRVNAWRIRFLVVLPRSGDLLLRAKHLLSDANLAGHSRIAAILHGRLMLTVLGGLAEFERELIRARTGQGRKRAKGEALMVHRSAPPSCVLRRCQKLLL